MRFFFRFFFFDFLSSYFSGGLLFFSQGWICPWHFDARQRGTMLLQICSICTIGFKINTTQKNSVIESREKHRHFFYALFTYIVFAQTLLNILAT